jgi:excisionase family DNA binding protein
MAPREAAQYLGCTTQHLQMLRARRTGPTFVKFGRLIRYARKDLDSYLTERRVETKP